LIVWIKLKKSDKNVDLQFKMKQT